MFTLKCFLFSEPKCSKYKTENMEKVNAGMEVIEMSNHILENEKLRVTISDRGAELISVVDKGKDRERLWQADPAVWNRHAPILFPFVGKVISGKYRVNGQEYDMKTQHGFARDLDFN